MLNFDSEDYTIPRLMIKLMKTIYPCLANVYDNLIEKGEVYKSMLECEVDENAWKLIYHMLHLDYKSI
jgi:hypothetical protein